MCPQIYETPRLRLPLPQCGKWTLHTGWAWRVRPCDLEVATHSLLSSIKKITMSVAHQVSKKRKFVADGVFQAELGEFL